MSVEEIYLLATCLGACGFCLLGLLFPSCRKTGGPYRCARQIGASVTLTCAFFMIFPPRRPFAVLALLVLSWTVLLPRALPKRADLLALTRVPLSLDLARRILQDALRLRKTQLRILLLSGTLFSLCALFFPAEPIPGSGGKTTGENWLLCGYALLLLTAGILRLKEEKRSARASAFTPTNTDFSPVGFLSRRSPLVAWSLQLGIRTLALSAPVLAVGVGY